MASLIDNRAALAAMTSVITAFTSAVVVSTATIATSISQQITNEGGVATGLTSAEVAILTQVTSAIGSATPSSSVRAVSTCDTRTLYGAMTSILTALSSATSVTTGNMATQLSSLITVDTGLTSVESGLVTLFTSSLGSSSPATNAHSQV